MVSTYTDNLRLTKQGDNDNPNTWGQIVNRQVIELLEEAISGVATVNCTGVSDINLAASVQNGLSDQARHAVLELTGTIGANINVILPSVEKVYVIKASYSTSGPYSITLKTSGGSSGIQIPSGDIIMLYTKGVLITKITADKFVIDTLLTQTPDLDDFIPFSDTSDSNKSVKGSVSSFSSLIIPVGTILDFGGNSAPTGYLVCDGSAISRTTYANLFASIGTLWGSGDGSTTFNLPNLTRRATVGSGGSSSTVLGNTVGSTGGSETHTLSTSEMPSHTHGPDTTIASSFHGDYVSGGLNGGRPTGAGTQLRMLTTGATGGGKAHNNLQPSAVVTKIIKF